MGHNCSYMGGNMSHSFSYMGKIMHHISSNVDGTMGPNFESEWDVPVQN